MMLDGARLRNARLVLAVCDAHGLDPVACRQALTMVATECSYWNYENPMFPVTKGLGDGMPPTDLAPSTKESCGVAQQRPHIPTWWAPEGLDLDQQAIWFMSIPNAVGAFLARLVTLPRTDQPWREIQAVQGSEYDGRPGLEYAANYQGNWDLGGQVMAQLRAEGREWLEMVDQAGLEQALQDVLGGVKGQVADIESKISALWGNESLDGYPFDKTATIFSDTHTNIPDIIARLEVIRTWLQGGYSGADKDQNNVAGIWFKVESIEAKVDKILAKLTTPAGP